MVKEQTSVVEISVNNQIYKISCEEGQEEHIQNLAKFINNELEKLVSSVGQIGEARLLLMTCLSKVLDHVLNQNIMAIDIEDADI